MMFLCGANSIFTGDKLLTTANPKFSEVETVSRNPSLWLEISLAMTNRSRYSY
jgi:biotin synthase-like enzyme